MAGSDSEKGRVVQRRSRFGYGVAVIGLYPGMQADRVRSDTMAPGDRQPGGGEQEDRCNGLLKAGGASRRIPGGTTDGEHCLVCLRRRRPDLTAWHGSSHRRGKASHHGRTSTCPLQQEDRGEGRSGGDGYRAGNAAGARRVLGAAPARGGGVPSHRCRPRGRLGHGCQKPKTEESIRQSRRQAICPSCARCLAPEPRGRREKALDVACPVVDQHDDVTVVDSSEPCRGGAEASVHAHRPSAAAGISHSGRAARS